jgi:carbon starvation protein CstA
MISGQPLPAGRMFTLPLALIAGLTGCVAALSAKLPWYALPVLAAIPLAAWLMPLPKQSSRIQILLLSLLTFAFAGGAVYMTWRVAGDVPF